MREKIEKLRKIADIDCHCSEEEQETADCDNCKIHKASSTLNEIGSIIDYCLKEIDNL
ncbi:hypothetical protein KAR91_33965 [Candidatus Pacearchaeota archaeon]|nr:hypothetical protein [Candidatus Pacearchaeota archaeon]